MVWSESMLVICIGDCPWSRRWRFPCHVYTVWNFLLMFAALFTNLKSTRFACSWKNLPRRALGLLPLIELFWRASVSCHFASLCFSLSLNMKKTWLVDFLLRMKTANRVSETILVFEVKDSVCHVGKFVFKFGLFKIERHFLLHIWVNLVLVRFFLTGQTTCWNNATRICA